MTEIYLNFKYIGEIDNAKELVSNIIEQRRKGELSSNINIYYDNQ